MKGTLVLGLSSGAGESWQPPEEALLARLPSTELPTVLGLTLSFLSLGGPPSPTLGNLWAGAETSQVYPRMNHLDQGSPGMTDPVQGCRRQREGHPVSWVLSEISLLIHALNHELIFSSIHLKTAAPVLPATPWHMTESGGIWRRPSGSRRRPRKFPSRKLGGGTGSEVRLRLSYFTSVC